ncbi:MAG: SCO family protein [Gemmatimonadaceae bacterium]|nr:SCO family protein [Gemmatimonadota bacterium]MBP9106986.1 SCO family protein [Gemmatimonadaceae bacterium]MBK8649582.1 SCO family protein [Gemmatimonadota bacterium]MBK9410543.1 SCO family protein [Gemmatimonadota bacterium]MCC7323905.1 SCO family protein [Gemmatimonadaceae bacterium]
MIGRRGSWGRALALVALTVAAGACDRKPALPIEPIGGDFSLTDHTSQRFELASQRGKVVLIFFGYSFCPDVCPTTLSKLSSVTRRLGEDRPKVKTLYITVDPERDTPEVLKADLDQFDLDALGLTGTREEVDTVVKLYGAKYEIVPTPESAAPYTVSHSTTLYALDAKGRVRLQFPYEATVDQIVAGIRQILADES